MMGRPSSRRIQYMVPLHADERFSEIKESLRTVVEEKQQSDRM